MCTVIQNHEHWVTYGPDIGSKVPYLYNTDIIILCCLVPMMMHQPILPIDDKNPPRPTPMQDDGWQFPKHMRARRNQTYNESKYLKGDIKLARHGAQWGGGGSTTNANEHQGECCMEKETTRKEDKTYKK